MSGPALVFGGMGAIGSAIADKLEELGWDVAVADVEQAIGADTPSERLRIGADITSEDSVSAAFDDVVRELGPVTAVVNSAGITRDRTIHKMSKAEFEDVLAVNLTGPFLTTREFIRRLRAEQPENARVVNISSVSGELGNFGQANYAASKAGLVALTKVTAREIAKFGATANAVLPGFIETPMTRAMVPEARRSRLAEIPLGRAGTPEDVAELVGWLCCAAAGYVTGSSYKTAGGRAL